ncbi:MAG: hypothetical protein KAT90_12690, partial [Gammaproteobacteria bacterium]|nr:hypothetical protein [Gammaproteobacteria bacterium]
MAACDPDNSSYETPNTSDIATNPGVISQKNFSLLTTDIAPAVIDAVTGVFTKTDVQLTVYIGDRNNQTLTDPHEIFFKSEYGLIEPSCTTEDGSCSVTWSAIARPDDGGPGSDGLVTITAYTAGEESFTDTNGNNLFDDGDVAFEDIEEPYIDADETGSFTAGDVIIDVINTYDPFGNNETHDIADGVFNGAGCTHTSLCSISQSITVFDMVTMSLYANLPPLTRTIGGTVTGLDLASTGVVLQNNGGDNLTITANGLYTFVTPIDEGLNYNVTVLTDPTAPTQVCTVAGATGTVINTNITTANVTCTTTTFTIGGSVAGLTGSGLELQNNG